MSLSLSLGVAIDTAIRRGANPVMISRTLGVSIQAIEKRVNAIAERSRIASERRMAVLERQARHERPKAEPLEDPLARDKAAMGRWLALPIRYENAREPAWNAGAAARNDAAFAARREHWRSLGGVSDWSHTRSE